MRAWRICARQHAKRAFTGEGAGMYGGRWNHVGIPLVYTSATLSLAALELYIAADPFDFPTGYVYIEAIIPDEIAPDTIDVSTLPARWRRYPGPQLLRNLGLEWVRKGASPVLAVPSVIVPQERNYLINPLHRDFRRVEIAAPKRFSLDPRAWNRRVH